MLNRPQNAFSESTGEASAWEVDDRPQLRLVWLYLLMTAPLLLIAVRLAYVQCCLGEAYIAAFQVETSVDEPLPKRDGRILSSDGRVLADDLQQFDVLVHYRWAESPPNPAWLKQLALGRLERGDRRNKAKIDEAQKAIVAQCDAMWRRLAELTGTPAEKLQASRDALQQRVERIASRLEWNRQEKDWSERKRSDDAAPADLSGWWRTAWNSVVDELTTPPRRESNDPIIVREELSHHLILPNVTLSIAAEIQAHPERYPGLRIETSAIRIYPQHALAPHIVGARMPISEEELEERRHRFRGQDPLGYAFGDRIGTSGVEKTYDSRLRGVRGLQRTVRNRRGEVVRTEVIKEPKIGRDVVLTLHLGLQQRLEGLLDRTLKQAVSGEAGEDESRTAAGGCIVAIDVHTGAVLAAASAPRYDLDLFVHPDEERWKALTDDPRRPFFDRAIQMALPPGSVFKALTAIAFLESGKVDPDDAVSCIGYLDSPNRYRCFVYTHFGVGHGETRLSDALAQSCNVYFFSNARKTGPEPMVHWAERLGFGQPTGIDLPGEQAGHLPRPPELLPAPATGQSPPAKKWQTGDTLGLAIGQSRLLVTPVQVVRLMAAIANGGKLVTPHVVRPEPSVDDLGGSGPLNDVTPEHEPQPIPGLHAATLEHVKEGLEKVVADRRGTGFKSVRLKDVAIAGKTGTAEVGGGKPDHAWFAGYLPAERPRIAFVVVLEHGGSGGRAAGPVAREFAQTLLELGLLPRVTERGSDGGRE